MLPMIIISVVLTAVLSRVSSSPQHSYSSYNNLFRRGSSQPVYAAHPTQLPYTQPQQRRQYQQQQYQHQQPQQQSRQQPYQEQQPQSLAQPSFKASSGGYNPPKDVVPIIAYSNDLTYDGTYSYNYETGDGMSRQESGVMTNPGTPDEAQSVTGSYAYTAPDGTLIQVNYVADANGFRAEGAHLPTPPPIPEEIRRSLEYIAATQRDAPKQDRQLDYENQQRDYQRLSRRFKKK